MGGMCGLCCNPAGERGCCCFNLSIAVTLVAAYYGVFGGLDIYQAYEITPFPTMSWISGIITASVGGYLFLCVLLGVIKLGKIAWLVMMPAVIFTIGLGLLKLAALIDSWVFWGNGLSDGSIEYQTVMVTSTLSSLLSMGISFGFANTFWSAACVWKNGGSGCEFKSYKDLESDK